MASATDSTRPERPASGVGLARLLAPYGLGRLISPDRSPLARKIVAFNLAGLVVLIAGVLWLNPHRHSLVVQRGTGLASEARLIAGVFDVTSEALSDPRAAQDVLERLHLPDTVEVFVFDAAARLVASTLNDARSVPVAATRTHADRSLLRHILDRMTEAGQLDRSAGHTDPVEQVRALEPEFGQDLSRVVTGQDASGRTILSVAAAIGNGTSKMGMVAVSSGAGEIDRLAWAERERILQLCVVAIVVSIGLSLALASMIANPLSALASAAEIGRERDARNVSSRRVRIPDFSARRDEIGRLSSAIHGMVHALYDRIDANEQFAADVSHEIKNPLASLRSAVGTMRLATREDQRATLLDVIEHDVRRLDRLVSDISNASRLDSELVREEEKPFDLIAMVSDICDHVGDEAESRGIELIADLPSSPVVLRGLAPRLAQVFVNLLSNALSICEEGDAVRVWVRRRGKRVLVVVEDTGPGIPEAALERIFERFYSERPETQFGNNSGLGLAISRQIVEAHGGVIWAENIRPTMADPTSDLAGARFVVGLPI